MIKVKEFDVRSTLLYPSILNPLWVVWCGIIVIYVLLTAWWKVNKIDGYWEITLDGTEFRDLMGRDVLCGVCAGLLNIIWFSRKTTSVYAEYLRRKWFPYKNCSKESQDRQMIAAYKHFLKLKYRTKDES